MNQFIDYPFACMEKKWTNLRPKMEEKKAFFQTVGGHGIIIRAQPVITQLYIYAYTHGIYVRACMGEQGLHGGIKSR